MTTETTSPPAPAERARVQAPNRRLILIIVGVIILALVAYFGVRYLQNAALYVSTDDALVDSNMVSISPLGAGTLTVWHVKPGDKVRAGQVLGQVKAASGSAFINITAPTDGTILRVDGKEGQVVSQAQAIAFVANLDQMHITAFIDESEISKVRVGQTVEVTVDATGKNVYAGTISEILPAVASSFAIIPSTDRSNGNFTKVTQRVEIHIDIGTTANTGLFPGENAFVRIRTS
jgi:multidrug resistance efflux pump